MASPWSHQAGKRQAAPPIAVRIAPPTAASHSVAWRGAALGSRSGKWPFRRCADLRDSRPTDTPLAHVGPPDGELAQQRKRTP